MRGAVRNWVDTEAGINACSDPGYRDSGDGNYIPTESRTVLSEVNFLKNSLVDDISFHSKKNVGRGCGCSSGKGRSE